MDTMELTKTKHIKVSNENLSKIASMGGNVNNLLGGLQFVFPNCDIVYHWGSYGHDEGLWEIMPNPETMDDVKGYLTIEQALEAVKTIEDKKKV